MNIARLFKRNSPAHRTRTRPAHEPVRITPEDAAIAAHWGYTEAQWAELPSLVRVDKREDFFAVQGLAS